MVLFSIIAYTAFGFLCIHFIVSGIRKINDIKREQSLSDLYTDEKEHDEAIKQSEEFEMNYFERVRNGEQTQQFLSIGGFAACSLIRSRLFAEGIPTYIENEHINSMYSLNKLSGSAFSIKLFILVADYDRAYDVVADFISNCERSAQKDNEEKSEETAASTVKKVAAAVTTGCFFIPMPDGSEDKPMGITILPKI